MDPFTIGLIVSAVLGAAGIGASVIGQKKANETNIQLAREAQEFERNQIQEMNKYNAPDQQILRLQNAGLNPRLMYGQSANTGNQNQTATGRMPSVKNTLETMMKADPLGTLQQFNNIRLTEKKMFSEIARASKLDAEGVQEWLDTHIKREAFTPEMEAKVAKFKSEAKKYPAQLKKIEQGVERQEIDLDAYRSIVNQSGMSKEMQTLSKLLLQILKK